MNPLFEQSSPNMAKASIFLVPETLPLNLIGDPEHNIKRKEVKSVLQKSVRLFKRPRVNWQACLLKSKSEGNIKELVENDSKTTFFQSIYKSFKAKNKKQEYQIEMKRFHQSTPCLTSIDNEEDIEEEKTPKVFQRSKNTCIPSCKACHYSKTQEGKL